MGERLRIVTFNVFTPAYRLVAEWAARHGHRLVLLVTLPGRHGARYGTELPDLVGTVPEEQDVLVTTRLRRTAAPVIAALEPDLIVSATFPRRIPPEVTGIPRYGALNLHPSPLPSGRGPNPQRAVYEGDPTVGATLHRIEPEFDTGAILSRRERPRPTDLTAQDLLCLWLELSQTVLEEGTRRAIGGERGDAQDDRRATYCPLFTDEERWLCWAETAATVQRRAAALNVGGPTARAVIGGRAVLALDVRAVLEPVAPAAPGTVLDRAGDMVIVRVADGAVSVRACALHGQRAGSPALDPLLPADEVGQMSVAGVDP